MGEDESTFYRYSYKNFLCTMHIKRTSFFVTSHKNHLHENFNYQFHHVDQCIHRSATKFKY